MTKEGWRKIKWGEIATLEYGKSLINYKARKGSFPVYGTNGVIGNTDKPLCVYPSVIIGRKGAYRGVHYSKTPFFVIDTAFYLKPSKADLDLKFAYYQLLTQNINEMDSGSAIPSTSREDFYNLDLLLPDKKSQQDIASILSSLDDKIELNLQMNKTLEAIAQAIFKEWFVDFRFPGFDGELVDGLPKGWRKVRLSNNADIQIGRTPPRIESKWFTNVPSDKKWISIKDMGEAGVYISNTAEYLTYEAMDRFRIPEIPAETVILSFKLTVGRVCITTEEMLSNEAIAQIRTDLGTAYIYCYLSNFDYKSLGSTSSIATAVNSKSIKELPLLLPTVVVLNQFRDTVSPLFERIKINCFEIQSLEKIRNLLLPKLMTGQIRVTI
jgi:type I restriction enzyme, S subunit